MGRFIENVGGSRQLLGITWVGYCIPLLLNKMFEILSYSEYFQLCVLVMCKSGGKTQKVTLFPALADSRTLDYIYSVVSAKET